MEKKDVLLSIVIPVWNRAGVVCDTLNSIAGQSYRSFELVIVDNGSDDDTLAVLEAWERANEECGFDIRIESCTTPGAAAARNHGLSVVRAPWVMFFDSDDIMHSAHLSRVAEAICNNPEADIIGWDTIYERLDGSRRRCGFFGTDMERHNLFDGAMATQRWVARTALVRSVGGWDENVGYWDDIELGSRMLAADPQVKYIGVGGVLVRESGESISSAGANDPGSIEPALSRMEKTLGSKGRRWCRMKRAVEYALSSRGGSPEGLRRMKAMKPSPLLWAAYWYTRAGGRGVARIMKF